MDRPLISSPACAATDDTSASLVACPPVVPTLYDFELAATFDPDFEGIGPTYLISTVAPLVPEPGSLVLTLGVSLPESPAALPITMDDVPGTFSVVSVQPADPASPVAVILPLAFMPPSFTDGPFWLRAEIADDQGCVTTAYAYFPEGLSAEPTGPTPAYVSINGTDGDGSEDQFIAWEIPDDGDPTGSVEFTDVSGVCPPPIQSMAVAPGCDFPVQVTEMPPIEVEFPVTPPVSLTVDSAQVCSAAGTTEVEAGALPAGAVLVQVVHTGSAALAGNSGRIFTLPDGSEGLEFFASDGALEFAAPAGFVFPAVNVAVSTDGGASGGGCVSLVGFYPPA